MLHQDGMAFGSLDGQQNSVLFETVYNLQAKTKG